MAALSAAAGLFGHGRSRLVQGAATAPCALGVVQSLAATARSWTGATAVGTGAAFHMTAPCEAKLRMRGTVVSDKAQKSVVVAVERIYKHPVVKKYVKSRSKFMAHDELDQFKIGDEIWIEEHRPISRRKRFMAMEFVDPSKTTLQVPAKPDAIPAAQVPVKPDATIPAAAI